MIDVQMGQYAQHSVTQSGKLDDVGRRKELQVHRALRVRKDYSDYEIYKVCEASSSYPILIQIHVRDIVPSMHRLGLIRRPLRHPTIRVVVLSNSSLLPAVRLDVERILA